MNASIALLLVLCLTLNAAHAAEEETLPESKPAVAAADEAKAQAAAEAEARRQAALLETEKEQKKLYQKEGMTYADKLYSRQDGTAEDEVRSRKAEILNYKLREKTIRSTETLLKKSKKAALRAELLKRLGKLHEQQAETVGRRSDLKDKTKIFKQHLETAVRLQEQLRREYRDYAPDDTLFSLGENYVKLQKDKPAERNYQEIVDKFPTSAYKADSLLALGNIYFDRKAFGRARAFYRQILTVKDQTLHPYAHYKSAWCLFNESDVDSAILGLEAAIRESRRLNQGKEGSRRLGVEDEALTDLVLFYSEKRDPEGAKAFFERIVERERAKELRVQLAKRFFDHGQNRHAFAAAAAVLADDPPVDQVAKLHLVVISAAERTQNRTLSIEHLGRLAAWLKNHPKEEAPRTESEEFVRNFALKLHHEAETLKSREIWLNAKAAYKTYLDTFTEEKDIPEMQFRYGVLLMHLKEFRPAFDILQAYLGGKEIDKHLRFKEALKLRIQTFELADKDARARFSDIELVKSYDDFALKFPQEALAPEAAYKAAGIAKKLETPEAVAQRYRKIAETYPKHALAKNSVSESLTLLVKSEKWEILKTEAGLLLEKSSELKDKISEAKELAMIKLSEGLEKAGDYSKARDQYEAFLKDKPSPTFALFALVKLAQICETKLDDNEAAVEFWEKLRTQFPSAKESAGAELELARLLEKLKRPKEAVKHYLAYGAKGSANAHVQALTNAAVTLEAQKDWEASGDTFLALRKKQTKPAEAAKALEAGCSNYLTALSEADADADTKALGKKFEDCSEALAAVDGPNKVYWSAHHAWVLDRNGLPGEASKAWKQVAQLRWKSITQEGHKPYVAFARLRDLEKRLADYRTIRFSKSNEKPEVNIAKKSQGMDAIEQSAVEILQNGGEHTVVRAKELVGFAYLEFAAAMEAAAVPSRLSDKEKQDLKASFVKLASELREKAYAVAPQLRGWDEDDEKDRSAGRKPASLATQL